MKNRLSLYVLNQWSKIKSFSFLWFLPFVLCILLSAALLVNTSWAWFVSSVQTSRTIKVANFVVEAVVTDVEGTVLYESQEDEYFLNGNSAYTVTLMATSTSLEGYCIVRCGEQSFCTSQILKGEALSFTVVPEESMYCTFTAMWGESTGEPAIENGSVLNVKQL